MQSTKDFKQKSDSKFQETFDSIERLGVTMSQLVKVILEQNAIATSKENVHTISLRSEKKLDRLKQVELEPTL